MKLTVTKYANIYTPRNFHFYSKIVKENISMYCHENFNVKKIYFECNIEMSRKYFIIKCIKPDLFKQVHTFLIKGTNKQMYLFCITWHLPILVCNDSVCKIDIFAASQRKMYKFFVVPQMTFHQTMRQPDELSITSCTRRNCRYIFISLSSPLKYAGEYVMVLKIHNTHSDLCNQEK